MATRFRPLAVFLICVSITIEKFPPINIQFFPVWRAKSGVLIGPFALLEPVRIVAGFQDIAVVGDAVK